MAKVVILGVFVADTAYRADRQPNMGETILGHSFKLGPGGKGSNQAVAAGRLGGDVAFFTKLGRDAFADMARTTWIEAGVQAEITEMPESYTGAAYIFVEEGSGNNAIIVAPGAAATLSPSDIDARADLISAASVFVTQLEQPVPAALRALEIARAAKVTTILNPAPAARLPEQMFALCDWITPNEGEAEILTGIKVADLATAQEAAEALLAMGVGAALITMGENGVLLHRPGQTLHIPAFSAGPVVETTGAGDAFNGAFAVGLSECMQPAEAARFGCAAASISVTRAGAAPSMPSRTEVEALLAR